MKHDRVTRARHPGLPGQEYETGKGRGSGSLKGLSRIKRVAADRLQAYRSCSNAQSDCPEGIILRFRLARFIVKFNNPWSLLGCLSITEGQDEALVHSGT
ncbi:hypothetical protein M404DRAFT_1003028 [Pisolithus tinctorius Marx 270]|uniref:Uncharacterized protein n=1 Tax=Pisolithus tinctorius Marx 270 TaxID=870435 RepID=A0A0C3NKZ0_PISTI|nr:hypothetical protein M404DRAFT_1003028 [Pisolithus tinctorius Marx 270]